MRNKLLLSAAILPICGITGEAQAAEAQKHPNIIMFLVDDMGWQDTSLPFWTQRTHYNDIYETPNMERLAAQGMMFTQAYACSVSSPSRVSLFTGMNAARHRVTSWTLHKNKTHEQPDSVLIYPEWNVNGICQEPGIERTTQVTTLAQVLKENGYYNLFFMTHEGQYDNMNAFFRTNGYDEVFSQEDYPADKVVNSFGVQDDFLYDYAIPVLNQRAATGEPFFATLLSISNHPPYVIPPFFHPKTSEPEMQIVEYADWALRQFFEEARKQPWFDNTIFVLEGDHGKLVGDAECELPESYNHIPLMIYSSRIQPEEKTTFGGQVDIQPTILGLLNIDYLQNNFGVDLLKEERPCMFYTADNMVVGRNDTLLYLYNYETQQELTYDIGNGKLNAVPMDDSFLPLKEYSFSMLQSAEFLVKHGKTLNSIPFTQQ